MPQVVEVEGVADYEGFPMPRDHERSSRGRCPQVGQLPDLVDAQRALSGAALFADAGAEPAYDFFEAMRSLRLGQHIDRAEQGHGDARKSPVVQRRPGEGP